MSLILGVLDGTGARPGDARPALGPDVLLVQVADGSSRLLDLGGRFIGLNPGTTRLLRDALEAGRGAAARATAAATGEAEGRIAGDLDALIAALRRGGFLESAGGPSRRSTRTPGRRSRAVLRRLLAGAGRSTWRTRLLLGLAWVSFRTLGWPRTVALWGACAGAAGGAAGDAVAAVDAAVIRAVAGHALPVACKEKALVSWALLKHQGQAARLVLGVALYPFRSHCWCEAGGRHVADFAERCDVYDAVRVYE
jgi:hypothetical protein